MLQIPCPWCGIRDESEYHFGGQSHITRPSISASDTEWSDYLFNRDNTKGIHYERWLHSYGCGRWFNMARDTINHEIITTYRIGEPKPEHNS